MAWTSPGVLAARHPRFVELYTPKLVTVLHERYRLADLKADAMAGLTVAIVALPLSMAIAIASGVAPERGLYTAIVGGFFVSALGGSRFQIGGPAGAFIILVAATVARHGIDGLLLATMLSGLILMAIGLLRLGTFIKYVPFPVTVGFTAGIAVIIFASQLRDLLGLVLAGPEPGSFLPKMVALAHAMATVRPATVAVGLLTIGTIIVLRRLLPRSPGFLVAISVAAFATWLFDLPVETIGSRFGALPRGLPLPHLPAISFGRIAEMLPVALSFALLGGIESLLSAVVADSMSGRRHRSNCELVAQGVANVASALVGGICVTGTIARTATNVRAGARGPIAGMLHCLILLGFMAIAAPLASAIPLAALAGLLAVVAWNMAEKHEFALLLRASRGDAVVLLATFLLVIFRNLTEGILVGFGLGALLFLHRMAQAVAVGRIGHGDVDDDRDDQADAPSSSDRDLIVLRLSGALFFGAVGAVSAALAEIGEHPRAYVLDLAEVPLLDSTAAAMIAGFARDAARHGTAVHLAGAAPALERLLVLHGVGSPLAHYHSDAAQAVAAARLELDRAASGT